MTTDDDRDDDDGGGGGGGGGGGNDGDGDGDDVTQYTLPRTHTQYTARTQYTPHTHSTFPERANEVCALTDIATALCDMWRGQCQRRRATHRLWCWPYLSAAWYSPWGLPE